MPTNPKKITLNQLCEDFCGIKQYCDQWDKGGCHDYHMLPENEEAHLEALIKLQDNELDKMRQRLISQGRESQTP